MKRNASTTIIAAVMSLVLLGAGVVLVSQGLIAKADVRVALEAEHITTPDDASIPGVPVNSAATAMAQADIIQAHTLEATGGRTWAQMERDDEMRPFYLQAASLRTALLSSYLAFKLADLVTGLGALFAFLGIGGLAASGIALRQERAEARATVSGAVRDTVNA